MSRLALTRDKIYKTVARQLHGVVPCWVCGQHVLPAAAGEVSDEARKASLGAMTNLMCRGRKRGLAGVIATQRLAKLAKNVAAEASNFLMGRTFLDIDMARAADLLGMDRRQAEMFRDLQRGHFVALGPALSRRPLPIVIGTVETGARSQSPKLLPLPDAAEDTHELIFARDPDEEERAPRRPAPPRPVPVSTADLLARLVRTQPAATPSRPAEPEMDEAERDVAFDAVLRELLEEPDAAFRTVAVLYQDFLVRCRIRRVPGEALSLSGFRRRLAVLDLAARDPPLAGMVALRAAAYQQHATILGPEQDAGSSDQPEAPTYARGALFRASRRARQCFAARG